MSVRWGRWMFRRRIDHATKKKVSIKGSLAPPPLFLLVIFFSRIFLWRKKDETCAEFQHPSIKCSFYRFLLFFLSVVVMSAKSKCYYYFLVSTLTFCFTLLYICCSRCPSSNKRPAMTDKQTAALTAVNRAKLHAKTGWSKQAIKYHVCRAK